MKTIVITGASTGIGRATSEYLASKGWQVFAGVRKEADGHPLAEAQSNIVPVIIDVAKSDQIQSAVAQIAPALEGRKLDGLINNAGIADLGPLPIQPMDEIKAHFDINVLGLIEVTQNFLPLLGTETERTGKPGRIINISSFGGRLGSPFLGAYCATKAAVESLTDSFRRELLPFGIDAITLAPGAFKTAIWDKAEARDEHHPYANTAWAEPIKAYMENFIAAGHDGWPAIKLAAFIEDILTAPSPKAYYAIGPSKFINYSVATRLPKRFLDKGLARNFNVKLYEE